jgi:hypothetical protein
MKSLFKFRQLLTDDVIRLIDIFDRFQPHLPLAGLVGRQRILLMRRGTPAIVAADTGLLIININRYRLPAWQFINMFGFLLESKMLLPKIPFVVRLFQLFF